MFSVNVSEASKVQRQEVRHVKIQCRDFRNLKSSVSRCRKSEKSSVKAL